MLESRWGRRLGAGIAVAAGVLAITSSAVGTLAVEGRPPPGCADLGDVPAATGGAAWFRLEPVLGDGARTAQRLEVGRGDERPWTLDLAAESFATGPVGGQVLFGSDDGRRSRIALVDTGLGCLEPVAESSDVIRTAIVTPDGSTLYESRVRRDDRRDLGVWRRSPITAAAEPVLPPLPAHPAFGPTWLTDLRWADDGRRLVVGSCGEVACRVRVLDPATGAARTVADPDLGSVVGLAGDRLVLRGACRGLPCPVVALDLESGVTTVLEPAAAAATVARDARSRTVVVIERLGDARSPQAFRLDAGVVTDLPIGDGPLAAPMPEVGIELPDGWVGVADPAGPRARRLDDAITRRLDEVRP